jgi:hypothetical protein
MCSYGSARADKIILMVMFSFRAFDVHAFSLFKWFPGQRALKDSPWCRVTVEIPDYAH